MLSYRTIFRLTLSLIATTFFMENSSSQILLAGKIHISYIRTPKEFLAVSGFSDTQWKRIEKRNLSQNDWQKIFRITVGKSRRKNQSSMLGIFRVLGKEKSIRFEPGFPLRHGTNYVVTFDLEMLSLRRQNNRTIEKTIAVPEKANYKPSRVAYVYPSSNKLPENQLKFYIHFSQPMSRGEAYDAIHLYNEKGHEIDYPFLKLGQELWNGSGTRFTLFIDPGRIKHGLKPREDIGSVLEEGGKYRLVIEKKWEDAAGKPLVESFEKRFEAIAPDSTQPDPSKWKFQTPSTGTKNPLVVTFPESLDHAMLQRVVNVVDSLGKHVPGIVKIDKQETRWSFTPKTPWKKGNYALRIETTLEDLAGNSIGRPFEVDIIRPIKQKIVVRDVDVPFRIRD